MMKEKVLGVLIHLSEHRGRNLASGDFTKAKSSKNLLNTFQRSR